MKSIYDQDYYEILELPYKATPAEIQTHYILAKKTYAESGLGGYSLFDDQEQKEILKKIETAYHVLSDPSQRARYDQTLAAAVPEIACKEEAPAYQEAPTSVEEFSNIMAGEQIKRLRQRKGMTLEEIADTTRINIHYLSSIEANRFESLPAEVYVYSYLRQMVKMIQCEDREIVEKYMTEYRTQRPSARRM